MSFFSWFFEFYFILILGSTVNSVFLINKEMYSVRALIPAVLIKRIRIYHLAYLVNCLTVIVIRHLVIVLVSV